MKKLSYEQTRLAVLTAWKAGLVPNIIGPVGSGKTALIKQIHAEIAADRPGFGYWQVLTSAIQSVDIGGYPVPPASGDKVVKYLAPSYIPFDVGNDDGNGGILFFDEVDRGPMEVLNTLTQLLHGGQVHDFKLKKGVLIVCAMNGETDDGTTTLSKAVKSRMMHIQMDENISPEYYKTKNWEIEEMIPTLKQEHCDIQEAVGALNKRTLEFALRLMDAHLALCQSPDWTDDQSVLQACVEGILGGENADIFLLHNALPTISQVEKAPTETKIPEQPAGRICMAKRLADAWQRTRAAARKEAIIAYGSRLSDEVLSAAGVSEYFKAAVANCRNVIKKGV